MTITGEVVGTNVKVCSIINEHLKLDKPIKFLISHTKSRFILSDIVTYYVLSGEGEDMSYRHIRNPKVVKAIGKHVGYALGECLFAVKNGLTVKRSKFVPAGILFPFGK